MRKSGNNSALFFILGIALIVVSVILIVISISMIPENNFYVQLEYYYQHGTEDATGSILAAIVIGLSVLGGILIICRLYINYTSKRKFRIEKGSDFDDVDSMIEQMAGTTTIYDTFHTEDKTICFYRDKTCIMKSGEKVFRGKMEPIEWNDDHPTLWDIFLDCNGEQVNYKISKVEGNILVKGDQNEEVFIRA